MTYMLLRLIIMVISLIHIVAGRGGVMENVSTINICIANCAAVKIKSVEVKTWGHCRVKGGTSCFRSNSLMGVNVRLIFAKRYVLTDKETSKAPALIDIVIVKIRMAIEVACAGSRAEIKFVAACACWLLTADRSRVTDAVAAWLVSVRNGVEKAQAIHVIIFR